MTTGTLHPLARDYLERLRKAAAPLPADARRDLVAEIEAHLAEALPEHASDAEALTVLDRLGEPEEIVGPELPSPARDPRGVHEWAAIVLLLLGGFVFGVGWIAGVILLWSSRAWTTVDKWIGTLIVPGGLATTLILLVGASSGGGGAVECGPAPVRQFAGCQPATSSGPSALGVAALVVGLAAPLVAAVYLARRARVRPAA
jgi:hypothetical protein